MLKRFQMGLMAAVLLTACSNAGQSPEALGTAGSACDYGTPHPSMPAEFAQFAFLIGDYDITSHAWTGQGWTPPRPGPHAQWNGRYGLGGKAIYDEWFDPNPQENPDAPRGVNVRTFDSESGEWKMMWIHMPGYTVQDLRAKVEDGVLTMWQVSPERPNFKATFIVTDKDHWHREHFEKNEAGDWLPKFKLAATRIPCE